jgi:WD40 repeat protein
MAARAIFSHLPRLRFSLLTLVLFVILVSASVGLWWRWEPWVMCAVRIDADMVSPDGHKIAHSISYGVTVLNVDSGQKHTIRHPSCDLVSFSFSADGRRLVTSGEDGTARVWDAETGRETTVFSGHGMDVCVAAFSPDGRRVVTGGLDRNVRVWNAETGIEQAAMKGHEGALLCVAFSTDGQRVLTASEDNAARVWDSNTGLECSVVEERDVPNRGARLSFDQCAFSPDGKQIITVWRDEVARVRMMETGQERIALKGHEACVCSAGFSPDGKQIVTGSHDQTARVWDADTGLECAVLRGHDRQVSAVFLADGNRIATRSYPTTRIWSRRRPEYWWGIAWLPEFWIALIAGGGLLVIAARRLRNRSTVEA